MVLPKPGTLDQHPPRPISPHLVLTLNGVALYLVLEMDVKQRIIEL